MHLRENNSLYLRCQKRINTGGMATTQRSWRPKANGSTRSAEARLLQLIKLSQVQRESSFQAGQGFTTSFVQNKGGFEIERNFSIPKKCFQVFHPFELLKTTSLLILLVLMLQLWLWLIPILLFYVRILGFTIPEFFLGKSKFESKQKKGKKRSFVILPR